MHFSVEEEELLNTLLHIKESWVGGGFKGQQSPIKAFVFTH